MVYASQQDLVERFGETEIIQLSDRINAGAIDVAVVATKLADASAEIDSYLVGRYTLPLDPIPAALQRIASDIARYHLYEDRPTEYVAQRYKDAIRFLELVGKGQVQLGTDPDGNAPPSTGGLADFVGGERTFTRDSLKGYTR